MAISEYIYGLNPAFEVCRAARRQVNRAFLRKGSAEGSPRFRKLVSILAGMKVALEYVTKQRLFQLCQSHEHQGVVLNVSTYPYVPFESLVEKSKLVLMDNIEDPQNVGAILRCAEVFGWQAVLLSSKGVPGIYPSVVKASAGASEHLLIAQDHAANDYVKALLERNFTLVALDEDGREDLTSLKFEPGKNILLAIGGEHKSIGQYILNLAQHVVRIRQHGKVQSLNAAVAAGIALFVLAEK